MKLVKSLLLGSAAGLSAVAGAQAADLPVKRAAPVEYVRVCSAYGAGFFYIPGTDTCLRVGGRARFEYEVRNQRSVGADNSGYRGLGRLNLDARTQTPYGTLRAFVRFEIAKRTGNGVLRSGTQERKGNALFGVGVDEFGRAQTDVNIDKAFIQFAGFTAGRAASFYDFYAHDLELQGNSSGSDVSSTNLLAYTATFGSGWSATIAMEDPTERRQPFFNTSGAGANGVSGINSVFNGFAFPINFTGGVPGINGISSTAVTPIGATFDPVTGLPTSFVNLDVTQRNKLPDFVGVLRVDQAWGSAQLSGAIHELNFGNFNTSSGQVNGGTGGVTNTGATITAGGLTTLGGTTVAVAPVRRPDTEYGFAIQGGLKVNLPMIAAGDVLWLQAAYGDGTLNYAGVPNGYIGQELSVGNITNRFGFLTTDATIDAFGRVHKTEAATAVAAFLHYWTPEWRSAFVGSYATVDFDSQLRSGFGPAGLAPFAAAASPTPAGGIGAARTFAALSPLFMDYEVYTASANLIWSPVKDLDIGVEAFYIKTQLDGRVLDQNRPILRNFGTGQVLFGSANFTAANLAAGFVPKTVSDDNQFVGRIRVQRDF